MTPIERAVAECGSQAALAKAIRVTPVFVNQMRHGLKQVPARLCRAIETATGGAVTAEQLRPDVFGEPKPDHAA